MCWRLALVALLLVCGFRPGLAAAAPPAAELFFKPEAILQTGLAPDGKRLAFTTAFGRERIGLYVVDLVDRAARPQPVAVFHDGDVGGFHWLGNGRLLFNVYDRSRGLMQQEAPGLYAVNVDGSGIRELIMRGWLPTFVQPTTGRVPPLEPDHTLLHVPPPAADGRDPEHVIVGKMAWAGNHWGSVEPMSLNVRTGRSERLDFGAPDKVSWWLFDRRGEPRVAVTREQDVRRVHWRGPGDKGWRVIQEGPAAQEPWVPHSVDEDGTLYVLRQDGAEGLRVLTRFDFATGRPTPEPFVRTPGFDFRGSLLHDVADGRLLGVRTHTDAESTVWLDPALKALQALIDERAPTTVNRIACRRCGAADMVALIHSASDQDPGQVWIWRADAPAGQQAQLVARVRPGLDPKSMATMDLVRIRARDGLEIPVWLTVPPGRKAGDKGPAIVLVHGGPWSRGGFWQWSAQAQFLASRGWLVIEPEFRGSTGYGQRHTRAGDRQWGRAMQDDIADATLWAQAQGWADRFCIAGGSYGGYATLMGLVKHRELYRCGAAWVAVTDLFLFLEGSWWVDDDISSEGRRFDLKRMVGDPERDAELLRSISPLHQAAKIDRPLLLVHGERDRRVPLAHAERLRKAMREAGREPEWVTYPGEGHGWLKLANHVDFANRLEAFFGKHLGQP